MNDTRAVNPTIHAGSILRVLDTTGDAVVASWDPANETQVNEARKVFASLIAQGYKAYETTTKGDPTDGQVEEFDRDLIRLYFEEPEAPAAASSKEVQELNHEASQTVMVPPVKGGMPMERAAV